tara:strand:+ start:4103 stop:4525 length:423 start_codon:yes stop_codon:yes gene_type:complete
MGSLLAFDFGEKRLGIAHTDPLNIIASGLTTLSPSEAINFLKKYKLQNNIDTLVIGQSKRCDGSFPTIEKKVLKFINELERNLPEIKIIRYDERFTSKIAKKTILESGLKKLKRRNKKLVDKISATIILQSYLESIKNTQ